MKQQSSKSIFFKTVLLFLIFSSSLIASTLDVSKNINLDAYKDISFIKDENFSINELKNKNFQPLKKSHIGTATGPFWTKLVLTNSSNTYKDIILYNPLAGTNSIDVFVFKDDKLIKQTKVGDFAPQENVEFLSRYPSLNLLLNSNETFTIYSKIENFGVYNLTWYINEYKTFFTKETDKFIKFGLLQGLGIFFILLNIFNYYIYRNKLYILLSFVALSLMTYQSGFHGVLYYLNLGLNLDFITALTWNSSMVGAIFILLFAYYFFDMSKKYKKISYYILFNIAIYVLLIASLIYGQFYNIEIFKYASIIGVLIILTTLSLFVLSIYFIYKKELSSKHYFVAEAIFLFALVLNTLGLFNFIDYEETYKYLIPFSHLISYIVYMFALDNKSKKEYQMLRNAKNVLMEKYRFNSMEQAIGNITHQWKHPLTKIGTTFALLEVTFKHNKSNFENIFLEKVNSVNNSIDLMKKIIDEFSTNITKVAVNNEFNIKETIKKCIDILDTPITLNNIDVKLDVDNELRIKSDEHLLMNILLVFLNNSIDAFKEKKIEDRFIGITFEEKDDKKQLTYSDNAGGIKLKEIDQVFDYLVSTKKDKDGKGIGLAIVKMLVEEKLNGTIEVRNVNGGCEFNIQF